MDREKLADGQKLILLINSHSECVRKRIITCATTVCCHCGLDAARGQTPFTFHGTRIRRFLVVVGSYVHRVAALLSRWRCPRCHRTFTDYPPFACPHKAYTLPQITEHAAKYVSNMTTSYRKGVNSANRPIFYTEEPADKSAQCFCSEATLSSTILAHTSLFHWVTTLGMDAQRQLETLHAGFAPASRKYTSERRRSILIACRATCSTLLSGHVLFALPCK
jgi:hypothetical protein